MCLNAPSQVLKYFLWWLSCFIRMFVIVTFSTAPAGKWRWMSLPVTILFPSSPSSLAWLLQTVWKLLLEKVWHLIQESASSADSRMTDPSWVGLNLNLCSPQEKLNLPCQLQLPLPAGVSWYLACLNHHHLARTFAPVLSFSNGRELLFSVLQDAVFKSNRIKFQSQNFKSSSAHLAPNLSPGKSQCYPRHSHLKAFKQM